MAHCQHSHCIKTAFAEVEERCLERGLRLTETRREVLKVIWQGHKALTAAEIMKMLGNDKPPITYRALEFLEENGLVHHVASLNAYVGCPHPHHDHGSQFLICERCRTVIEIQADDLERQVGKEAKRHHFTVTRRHLEVMGLCEECR